MSKKNLFRDFSTNHASECKILPHFTYCFTLTIIYDLSFISSDCQSNSLFHDIVLLLFIWMENSFHGCINIRNLNEINFRAIQLQNFPYNKYSYCPVSELSENIIRKKVYLLILTEKLCELKAHVEDYQHMYKSRHRVFLEKNRLF